MNNTPAPRAVLIAVTRGGSLLARGLAARMPDAHVLVAEKFQASMAGLGNEVAPYRGPLRARIGALFSRYDRIVFFLSLGAVVRLIAPHLVSKYQDPAVLAVDDAGRFVIPVVSGHVGGANAFAGELAGFLGTIPVITTASDVNKTLSVDILGRALGWRVVASRDTITRVSAHVVNGEPVAVVQEAGSGDWWPRETPMPPNIRIFEHREEVDPDRFAAMLWVTDDPREKSLPQQWAGRVVVYHPPGSG